LASGRKDTVELMSRDGSMTFGMPDVSLVLVSGLLAKQSDHPQI